MFLSLKFPVILLSVTLIAFGCKKSSTDTTVTTPAKEVSLQSSTTFGNYLVDKNGRTLYFFSNDASGQNRCTGGCENYWPVFNVANLTANDLGTGLNFSDFGHITTASGSSQLTYLGWPLYYYSQAGTGTAGIENAGQTLGDGVDGVWFVAKPDYTVMIVNAQLIGLDGKNYKSDYTEGVGTTIYFTDGRGVTLYTFSKDSANINKFTKADFSNNTVWPVYGNDQQIVVPSILDKTLFGTINVFGRKQFTYKKWPLYYFGQDGGTRGFNKGISFPTPGIWHVPVKAIQQAP